MALALGAAFATAAPAGETRSQAENRERLRSIPLEERQALSDKLKQFDSLSRAERSAIRALDERITQLPPSDQATYLSVLRRYHQWFQGLTEEQRKALNSVPPGERMREVTRLRAEDRTGAGAVGDTTPLFLRVVDFSAMWPFESASRLRAWFDLPPEKRAEIEKLPAGEARQKRLLELTQQAKVGPANRLSKAEEDALWAKLEENPNLKNWMTFPLKKADPAKHERVRWRMVANYYFIEHPPAPVELNNLTRFAAAMPSWYREQYDHLPPEEARRRLTILYRLVFSAPGEEMPPERKKSSTPATQSAPEAKKAAAPPRPSPTPPATGPNPF